MDEAIFTPWEHVSRIRSKGAFNNWGFVQEVCKLVKLIALKSIQKNNTVVWSCQQHDLTIIREFHYLDFVIIFLPVCEWPSLAVLCSVEAYPDDLFILLLDRPGYSEGDTCGVKICNRVSRHAFRLYIKFELAIYVKKSVPCPIELRSHILMVLSLLVVINVSFLGLMTRLVIVSLCPLNILMTLF